MDVQNLDIETICNAYSIGYSSGINSESYLNPFNRIDGRFKAYAYGYSEGISNRIHTENDIPCFLKRQAE